MSFYTKVVFVIGYVVCSLGNFSVELVPVKSIIMHMHMCVVDLIELDYYRYLYLFVIIIFLTCEACHEFKRLRGGNLS